MKKELSEDWFRLLSITIVCSLCLFSDLLRAQPIHAPTPPERPVHGSLRWKSATGGGIVCTPLLYKDMICYGSSDGYFYCSETATGRLRWKFKTGGPIRSTAVLAGDKFCFLSDDGLLYALDADRGKLRWVFATHGEKNYDMWDYYRSSPVLQGNSIYFGSGDGNIYAIDQASGKERWHFKTEGIVHADPVISRDTLFIGSFDGCFYALNAGTGQLIWRFKTIGDRYFPIGEIQKAALVTDDAVYFGSRDYNIYALNRTNGKGFWNRKEGGSWIIATPLLQDGRLYFGTSDSHAFYSLNTDYGGQEWKTRMPLRSYTTPLAYDTLILAGCFNGYLYGFGRQSGNICWSFQTESSRQHYNTIYDSTGAFRKGFTTFGDEKTATMAEAMIMKLGAIIGTPVLSGDMVYFGASDGYLYAVNMH